MSERKDAADPIPAPAPAPGTSKRKVTLYFNSPMLAETQHEAIRQDRSISWIVQAAWRRAREEIRRLPAMHETKQMNEINEINEVNEMKERPDESAAEPVDHDSLRE